MITGGDLRQSRLDVGYKTFTISPWCDYASLIAPTARLFDLVSLVLFSKPRRPFTHYRKIFFQSQASAGDGGFVEQTADEGNAVGDFSWHGEFDQRIVVVGCPVAAGFGDVYAACFDRQR